MEEQNKKIPLVSVYCLAYNHEKYIRSALEGFINQKTNFAYEVFVNDDASTDKTATIIREYAEIFPNIIKPIFQSENQYSKGVNIEETIIFPLMNGKYIAACEGDDYWCDENKLQMQVDWMENNPEYSLCVHNTKQIDVNTGKETLMYGNEQDKDIPLTDILVRGSAQFQTSSIMFRNEFKYLPEEFRVHEYEDYPRAIYLGICGKVHYFHQVMSVYRSNVDGSATSLMNTEPKAYTRLFEQIHMLQMANKVTKGKYSNQINELIRKREFLLHLRTDDIKTILADYRDVYDKLSNKEKLKLQLKDKFPDLLKKYRKLRDHYSI